MGGTSKAGPLLILGPNSKPYSYARIIRSIARHLADRYEICQFATDQTSPINDYSYPIYHNALIGDVYGVQQLPSILAQVRPRIVWIINDMWFYFAHRENLLRHANDVRTILYCPIDGSDLNVAYARGLQGLDRLVLFTRFAKTVVDEAVTTLKATGDQHSFPPISIIPHGVDTCAFRPLTGDITSEGLHAIRHSARLALFPDEDLHDSFIVLNANQNNHRKRLDLTVEGFAQFAHNKPPNVRLYLHTNTRQRGCELMPIARSRGIEDRLLFTTISNEAPNVSDSQLNLIYNTSDVGLNTSVGEGWGMVSFEHAASGAAQIVPRHSACEELWADAGVLIDAPNRKRYLHDAMDYRASSPELIAAALESLYASPDRLLERSRAAYRNATNPAYQWGHIAGHWDALFTAILAAS